MKRYVTGKMITVNDPEFGQMRVPAISQLLFPEGTSLAYEQADGKNFFLAVVTHPLDIAIPTSPDIDAMPDIALDSKVSSIKTATKAAMKAKLAARGVDVSRLDGTDGYRDLIRDIGQQLDPNFHEDRFGVVG